MQDSDFYSNFFEGLLNRFGVIQYENTYRALSDYFEHNAKFKEKQIDVDKDDITDVKGIAAFTKYSVPTIYTYVQQNKIPYYRPGKSRRVFFSKKEVLAWIKTNRSATRVEISDKSRSIKLNLKK